MKLEDTDKDVALFGGSHDNAAVGKSIFSPLQYRLDSYPTDRTDTTLPCG